VCERKIKCTFFGCYFARVFLGGFKGDWSLNCVWNFTLHVIDLDSTVCNEKAEPNSSQHHNATSAFISEFL
jgi:hypothetical protein